MIKNLLNVQETEMAQALWTAVVNCNRTLAAHCLKKYAYQAHAETLVNAYKIFLSFSWDVAFSMALLIVQVSDIFYLTLSVSADCLLAVNKAEIVKGSTQPKDDIKSLCRMTYSILLKACILW